MAEAARLGLAAIGITDHDTVSGNAEALVAGRELGVEVVPGVEVSSEHGPYTVHLLGYYPEPDAPALAALLAELCAYRNERNPRILARLAELGCPLSLEDVAAEAGGEVIGRPHIAAALVRMGYVRSAEVAFERYLGRGAKAYVERRKLPPAQSIDALLRSRAVPVLATPATWGSARRTRPKRWCGTSSRWGFAASRCTITPTMPGSRRSTFAWRSATGWSSRGGATSTAP